MTSITITTIVTITITSSKTAVGIQCKLVRSRYQQILFFSKYRGQRGWHKHLPTAFTHFYSNRRFGHSLLAENYLKDGMRSRGMVIGRRNAGSSDGISMLDESHDVGNTGNHFLLQADDLHMLLAILQHTQLLFGIQQVKHLHTHTRTHQVYVHQAGGIVSCLAVNTASPTVAGSGVTPAHQIHAMHVVCSTLT